MSVELWKKQAAEAALDYVHDKMIIGVGSGSTINYFINALAKVKHKIEGCVASSIETKRRLIDHGIPVFDLNVVDDLSVYVDGADEVDYHHAMVKGGGGALTREKIIASVAKQFVCIVDETKLVSRLGVFPVAVEVLPIARSFVARQIVMLGGDPTYRQGFVTDNGNIILDVFNLNLWPVDNSIYEVLCHDASPLDPGILLNPQHHCAEKDPSGLSGQADVLRDLNCQKILNSFVSMEESIKNIPGVVENGIFSKRLADKVIVAGFDGVRLV